VAGRQTAARVPATGQQTPWAWAAGTFFGAGLLRPGPGTWGSVAAVLLWMGGTWLIRNLAFLLHFASNPHSQADHGVLPLLTAAGALLTMAVGIPAATIVARESGRDDPGHVVIDEVAGQWLTLVLCKPDWPHALLALGLFRLFDITKPWPIRRLELLPAGWGIMVDDLGAGLYAAAVLVAVQHWW
jgi:phosphatidylglycerophosphatase A